MGWTFRKSVNLGPFRVNASKSGVGFSVGEGPFRTGVSPRGRTYASANVPGTGLRYEKTLTRGQGFDQGILGWVVGAGILIWQKFLKG